MSQCSFFRVPGAFAVPVAWSCIVLRALGVPVACCAQCEAAMLKAAGASVLRPAWRSSL